MPFPKIILKSRRDQRILAGHLWVFSNEIEHMDGTPDPGGLVDILSHKKQFLGRGFFNPNSLISARILTFRDEKIDAHFFAAKLEIAQRSRALLYPEESSYRLVFGESDLLPGLVIDRLENCL